MHEISVCDVKVLHSQSMHLIMDQFQDAQHISCLIFTMTIMLDWKSHFGTRFTAVRWHFELHCSYYIQWIVYSVVYSILCCVAFNVDACYCCSWFIHLCWWTHEYTWGHQLWVVTTNIFSALHLKTFFPVVTIHGQNIYWYSNVSLEFDNNLKGRGQTTTSVFC